MEREAENGPPPFHWPVPEFFAGRAGSGPGAGGRPPVFGPGAGPHPAAGMARATFSPTFVGKSADFRAARGAGSAAEAQASAIGPALGFFGPPIPPFPGQLRENSDQASFELASC